VQCGQHLSGVVEMFAYAHSLAEVRIEKDLGGGKVLNTAHSPTGVTLAM